MAFAVSQLLSTEMEKKVGDLCDSSSGGFGCGTVLRCLCLFQVYAEKLDCIFVK